MGCVPSTLHPERFSGRVLRLHLLTVEDTAAENNTPASVTELDLARKSPKAEARCEVDPDEVDSDDIFLVIREGIILQTVFDEAKKSRPSPWPLS